MPQGRHQNHFLACSDSLHFAYSLAISDSLEIMKNWERQQVEVSQRLRTLRFLRALSQFSNRWKWLHSSELWEAGWDSRANHEASQSSMNLQEPNRHLPSLGYVFIAVLWKSATSSKYDSIVVSEYVENEEFMDKLGEAHLKFSDYCSVEKDEWKMSASALSKILRGVLEMKPSHLGQGSLHSAFSHQSKIRESIVKWEGRIILICHANDLMRSVRVMNDYQRQ